MDFDYNNEEEHFFLDDYTDEKARKKRLKEEKKRRRNYKFSDKKHSKYGVISSWLALFSLVMLILGIILSTCLKGNAGSWIGAMEVFGFFADVVGICLSAFSFKETDTILKYSWIGIISNGVLFFIMGSLIIAGI